MKLSRLVFSMNRPTVQMPEWSCECARRTHGVSLVVHLAIKYNQKKDVMKSLDTR